MESQKIAPDKITKPIQLLGAWLVGLLTVDSAFLLAATQIDPSTWQSVALTIAAIVNVPIFIGALFLLQTKFRPELQEDSYYSTYLSKRTNESIKVPRSEAILIEIEKILEVIEREFFKESENLELFDSVISDLSYSINVQLPNREKILSELSSRGVLGVAEFGHSAKSPDLLTVAIKDPSSKSALKEILNFSRELGFTHYTFIEPFEEIDEDVLFGAYGDDVRRITNA